METECLLTTLVLFSDNWFSLSLDTFGKPEIFNTDQGSQFTSPEFTQRLLSRDIAVSMDGRARALDNVFIERLWRCVKHENIYLMNYEKVADVYDGLTNYFTHYNHDSPHQAHNGQTPASVFFKSSGAH